MGLNETWFLLAPPPKVGQALQGLGMFFMPEMALHCLFAYAPSGRYLHDFIFVVCRTFSPETYYPKNLKPSLEHIDALKGHEQIEKGATLYKRVIFYKP